MTKAVTTELESARCLDLDRRIKDSLDRLHFERWAWEACSDRMTSTWLHSPPDRLGYIENPLFRMIFPAHLGQPCPAMAPVVGRYFGQSGQQLDAFGANLAAAKLPGQGHRILHNLLQDVIKSKAKLGCIVTEKEAANFLINKVGEPWITRYVTHVSSFPNARKSTYGIVPDLQCFNFPVRRQTVNDSGATSSAVAIFEVKTYSACRSRYDHNTSATFGRQTGGVTRCFGKKRDLN